MEKEIQEKVLYWQTHVKEKYLLEELNNMNTEEKKDAFYQDLKFGTGGLRGVLKVGPACMNLYVVKRATLGLATYIVKKIRRNRRKVIIGYDTRHRSKEFAQLASEVLSAFDIEVHLFQEPLPTPCVSYAIRHMKACMGIMITASHNPAIYNGYKVYGQDGCQITNNVAKSIYQEIQQHDYFELIPCVQNRMIHLIQDNILNAYLEQVLSQKIQKVDSKELKIVYTPLYGTGRKPVQEILKKAGFSNVSVVKEQEMPNGDFPTCPKPNPEDPEALTLAIEQAKKENADLVLATDPDCDRVSIAIRHNDIYEILSANELGCLLLDYICANTKEVCNKIFLKTIVTTDLAEMIASHYQVKTINTLTGFKYIGEQISLLEKEGKEDQFLFGFEESCGFLKGSYVRDKDATVASLLICEMAAFYKTKNKSLSEKNQELYKTYQTCLNSQSSYLLEGAKGQEHIYQIMEAFRYEIQNIGQEYIVLKKDYIQGIDHLPPSNVIKLYLSDNTSIVLRPSGTEPKLKVYYSVLANDMETCRQIQGPLEEAISKIITNYQ